MILGRASPFPSRAHLFTSICLSSRAHLSSRRLQPDDLGSPDGDGTRADLASVILMRALLAASAVRDADRPTLMATPENIPIRDDLMMDHVPYEISMMRATHDGMGQLPPGICRNAYIESFAIHA